MTFFKLPKFLRRKAQEVQPTIPAVPPPPRVKTDAEKFADSYLSLYAHEIEQVREHVCRILEIEVKTEFNVGRKSMDFVTGEDELLHLNLSGHMCRAETLCVTSEIKLSSHIQDVITLIFSRPVSQSGRKIEVEFKKPKD